MRYPLSTRQKQVLCAMQSIARPATREEICETMKRRFGVVYTPMDIGSTLSQLITRGLASRSPINERAKSGPGTTHFYKRAERPW